jgi:hypothetical protein
VQRASGLPHALYVCEGKDFLQNSGRDAPREREAVSRPINVFARSEATRQSNPLHEGRLDCFASLSCTNALRLLQTMTENYVRGGRNQSEHKHRQLIKRISDFEADQNQGCDHQIKAEMHEKLETTYFVAGACDANQIHCVSGRKSARR